MMLHYRKIEAADDRRVAEIIRGNLERLHLDLPGTAYFDPQLDHMSAYYDSGAGRRIYFAALDEQGQIIGGVGVAEFDGLPDCAELQKLYLDEAAKGRGYGKAFVELAEHWAREAGYRQLYLETHSNLKAAMALYEKLGFRQIDRPEAVLHSTMDHFYLKEL